MEDKISVIIPIYNVEPYLCQCLDSVVGQTYENLEIILIDDGSPDNCGAICDAYAARDERVVVTHKVNGGLSAGWNDGMKMATGKWIGFVDSDDWIDEDYFEKLVKGPDEEEADIIIANGFIEESENEQRIVTAFQEPFVLRDGEGGEFLEIKTISEGGRGIGYVWNKLYRRAFIQKERLEFDPRIRAGLANDGLFNCEAYKRALCVTGISEIGYHYRRVSTSGSLKYAPDRPDAQHYVLERYYSLAKEHNASPAVFKTIDAYVLGGIYSSMERYYFHPENHATFSETSKQIAAMKKKPYYYRAIWAKSSQHLTAKQKILKYLLRLPWVWPLKMAYMLNEKVLKG